MNWSIQVKSTDDAEGLFEGVLSTYGNIDQVGDVCERGCFDRDLALNGARRPLLWQHDSTQPIGSFEAYGDEVALRVKGRMNLETAKGREAYALLKAGDIDGLSIGYIVVEYTYDNDGVRHLLEVRLLEGSLVTFPANTLARAQAKSLERRQVSVVRFSKMKSLEGLDAHTRTMILDELAEMEEQKSTPVDDEPDDEDAEGEDQTSQESEEEGQESEDQTDEDSDLKAEVEKLKAALAEIVEKLR
jgi:HK97 family phage prohead protease